jgi:anti-anti-sigma factor
LPNVSYTVHMIRGMPVVTTPEDIDVTSAYALRAQLLASAERGHAVVTVDMTRTHFCDSFGLNVLIRAHQRAQTACGGLRLVVQAPAILRILAVTGADQIIPCFTNLEDALAEPPASHLRPRPSRVAPPSRTGAEQRPYPGQHAGSQVS